MKKLLVVAVLVAVASVIFTGCGKKVEIDYATEVSLEQALNDGVDVSGKVAMVNVRAFKPNSSFGYNLIAGEHLNFVSSKNPGKKDGSVMVVRVKEVQSMMGSWIISYDLIE